MTKDTEIKNEKEKLSERINLRLTKSEYLKLKAKADEQNLTVNLFLRSKILEVAPPVNPIVLEKKVVKRVRDLPKIDPKMQKELNSIGVNINQIAHNTNAQINEHGRFDYLTVSQSLDRISEEINLLRQKFSVSNKDAS